ncbi:unnamed protein product, partial [Musa banksii]
RSIFFFIFLRTFSPSCFWTAYDGLHFSISSSSRKGGCFGCSAAPPRSVPATAPKYLAVGRGAADAFDGSKRNLIET